MGISVRVLKETQDENVYRLARETAELIGSSAALNRSDVAANSDYVGEGYGMTEVVEMTTRHESILLDRVYSGNGIAGSIDLVHQGCYRRDENIVFIHTGGAQALSGYRSLFGQRVV